MNCQKNDGKRRPKCEIMTPFSFCCLLVNVSRRLKTVSKQPLLFRET
jgi:hypothetical protein